MKIFLLGLPGSGKTTLGKELSELLRLDFVDLDLEIEKRAAKKIKEIFSDQGEGRFRELESAELKRWCTSQGGFVMATGGGTPCFFDNMEWINRAGTSVFLDVPIEELVTRMQRSSILERPLLASLPQDELKDNLGKKHTERLPFYRKAKVTISGETITAEEIDKKLGT